MEVSSKTLRPTYDACIEFLNGQLVTQYAANPWWAPVHLTLLMLKPSDGGHPTLKHKADKCRHLAVFAVWLANRQRRINLQLEDVAMVQHSAEYQNLAVDMAEQLQQYHLSCTADPFSETNCRTTMVVFLGSYSQLRLLFRRGRAFELHAAAVFGPRPKLHLCDHLVRHKLPVYGSPRPFWRHLDEDFMGLVKRITLMSKHPRSLERVLLLKNWLHAHPHAVALDEAGL